MDDNYSASLDQLQALFIGLGRVGLTDEQLYELEFEQLPKLKSEEARESLQQWLEEMKTDKV